MKNKTIILTILMGIASTFTFAQGKGSPAPNADRVARMQILQQFDKDGDGILSPQERALADEYLKKMQAERDERESTYASGIIEKFDADKDGKLDKNELLAFLKTQRDSAPSGMQPRISPEMIKKYDKDGDGQLNREEMEQMRKESFARFQELVKKYDKDGDGQLNREERMQMLKENPDIAEASRRMMERTGRRGPRQMEGGFMNPNDSQFVAPPPADADDAE